MKKATLFAVVLMVAACTQVPPQSRPGMAGPAGGSMNPQMCAQCPCCQKMRQGAGMMQGGMGQPSQCPMCAKMQQQRRGAQSTAPAAPQQMDGHEAHHPVTP